MKKIIFSTLITTSILFAGDYTNSIGMKFKKIPSGSFLMGTATKSTADCPKDNPFTSPNEYSDCVDSRTESVNRNEIPQHKVTLKGFYMAEAEVTQGQWYAVMGNNPAHFKTGNPNMPVEQVSWYDAQNFIKKLNAKEHTTKYRLPSEEEWEYTARAGTTTKWFCGDNENCLNSIAVYNTSSPRPVKSKKPNKWGIYDMHGNVYEWTSSWYSNNYNQNRKKEYKVKRGGGWYNSAYYTRSAIRSYYSPTNTDDDLGFRLVRTLP